MKDNYVYGGVTLKQPCGVLASIKNWLPVVALLALLGGCGEPHQPPLRLGTRGNWLGHEPFYLARDQGFFGSAPVQIVDYASAPQVQDAFRNGAIEAATLTLDEALQLAAQGFN